MKRADLMHPHRSGGVTYDEGLIYADVPGYAAVIGSYGFSQKLVVELRVVDTLVNIPVWTMTETVEIGLDEQGNLHPAS